MPISIKTTKNTRTGIRGCNDMEQCIAGVLMLLDSEVLQDKILHRYSLPVLMNVNPDV